MASVFVLKASGGPSSAPQQIDAAEVRRALELLADPEHVVQIVGAPTYQHANRKGSDLDGLVEVVERFGSEGAAGIYVVLNPLSSALPIKPGLTSGNRAKTTHVLKRRWLFIDIDPIKSEGFGDDAATDEEHEQVRMATMIVRDHLDALGWPSPIIIDSGNGFYLIYQIDLPVGSFSQSRLRKFLHSIRPLIAGKGVIDPKVHDAVRLAKIPGTRACKGRKLDDRPWRMCRLLHVPVDNSEIVTDEMIAAATGEDETPPVSPSVHMTNGAAHKSPLILKAGSNRADAYVKKVLDNECSRVALERSVPQGGGGRNNALYIAALKLGSLIGGGYLDRGIAEARLRDAARANGSYEDPGQGERGVEATIRSGIETGMANPRVIEDRASTSAAARKSGESASDSVPDGELIIIRASSITPRRVEWLWPGRIPLGKLTTFAGVGGLGKTFVLCDITSRVTRGLEWPCAGGQSAEPGQVLFVSGEDDPDDTLVPRLIEMQADLNRVVFLKTEVQDCFTLADLKTLDKAVDQAGPNLRFVAIDPPTAYLGGVDDHKNSELRGLLSPLKSWAAKRRIAIVFNTHVNKPQGAKVEAMMRVMGSVAWVNAVRAAHMFARDPEDHERRLFVGMKLNIGKEQKGLAYKIVSTGDLARVEWLGEVDTTADEAVNRERKRKRNVVAAEWLAELFRDVDELPSKEIWDRKKTETVLSDDALKEAKEDMGIKAHQICAPDGERHWVWFWPAQARQRWEVQTAQAKKTAAQSDEGAIPE